MTTRKSLGILVISVLVGLLSGCLDRELKALNPCLVSGVVAEISVNNVDKVDLLFVVDNSGSMAEEQEALRQQFPRLVRTLASGMRPDGSQFPPAKDLHLAVVTTDMGLPNITGIDKCDNFGDDGVMQRMPPADATGCPAVVPRFLQFVQGGSLTPDQVAGQFGCIATVGTDGCGFEQQLEASLKALWPSVDIDPATGQQWVNPATGMQDNRITFIGDTLGHGGPGDRNDGFLRNDPNAGLSLIAVVIVTDEEDCSSLRTDHFIPPNQLAADDPLRSQDLNLRCFYNPDNLFSVDRYIEGLKQLRPGNPNLVIFATIAGVPEDLVTEQVLSGVDLTDELSRNQFYDGLLADNRMQEREQQGTMPGQGQLEPSCNTATGLAFPPRRIIQVAKGFGANGVVQSICQSDFTPAIDAIIDVIARNLGAVCLPRRLVRNSEGKVDCNVVWELPAPNSGVEGTPTSCDDEAFLTVPEDGRISAAGGRARCVVAQLPVVDGAVDQSQNGWFYDDFSTSVMQDCSGTERQRIAFANGSPPPSGVTVQLECLSEVDSLIVENPGARPNDQNLIPQIGTPCERRADEITGAMLGGDAACVLNIGNTVDESLFCHREFNTCVRRCSSDNDCPAAWVCDDRPQTRASASEAGDKNFCVNPTCGST